MKNISILFLGFVLTGLASSAQTNDSLVYVVDNVLVSDDPDQGDEIFETDISDVRVISNKDTLKMFGYEQYKSVAFIFTKEFRKRPDSIHDIPPKTLLKEIESTWYFEKTKYTGPVIDYYYSGNKKSEGYIRNGKMTGIHRIYYQNGKIKVESHYIDGTENGESREYFSDGSLSEKGVLAYGKKQGTWESFYPNGQLKERAWYRNGHDKDTSTVYYSTGKIQLKTILGKRGTGPDPISEKKYTLLFDGTKSYVEGNSRAALRACNKALELDSNFSDAYAVRGLWKYYDDKYDEAIADFDKALRLEPYSEEALAYRALSRIKRFQESDDRPKNRSSENAATIKKKDSSLMPAEEKDKLCADLQKAIFLGDDSKKTYEALVEFCGTKLFRQ